MAGVPGWLAEIAELGLSTGAQMALVVARALYTYLDINRSVIGMPTNIEPAILEDLFRKL